MELGSLKHKQYYFDHNATTPLSPVVKLQMAELLQNWGNPSSIHYASRGPKQILRETRQNLASQLGCSPLEIIFTSGGSESNTTVLNSFWNQIQNLKSKSRTEFITSAVEHPSVRVFFDHIESLGAVVHRVPVSRDGILDVNFFKNVLSAQTLLVSIMFANNETGSIFPIQELAQLAHEKGAYFHSDCVQAFGKIPFHFSDLGIDYATFSAHKFYSLKGSGFIISKKSSPLEPLVYGGGQERHRRGGTENILAIGALGLVAPALSEVKSKSEKIKNLRDYFESKICETITDVQVTAQNSLRLPNTSSLIIKNVDGETMLMSLDIKGFAVSTGAACSSGSPEPSPVLLAVGLTKLEAQNSLRVSLGWENTLEEVDDFILALTDVVARLRKIHAQEQVI